MFEESSTSIMNLAKALSAAQGKIHGARTNARNPFLNSDYADLESYVEAAKPSLAENKLSIVQLVYNRENAIGVKTILMHESGEYISSVFELPFTVEDKKSKAQAAGSLITYIRRYSYGAMLGMYAAGEDNDGNAPVMEHRDQAPRTAGAVSPSVVFWKFVEEKNFDKKEAAVIVSSCKNDYSKAMEAIKAKLAG